MGATVSPAGRRFGKWLNQELKAQQIGKRTLAVRLAGKDAPVSQIESERRQLLDYSKGKVFPGEAKRRRIAKALRVRLEDMPDDDEDDLQADLRRTMQKIADRVPVAR